MTCVDTSLYVIFFVANLEYRRANYQ